MSGGFLGRIVRLGRALVSFGLGAPGGGPAPADVEPCLAIGEPETVYTLDFSEPELETVLTLDISEPETLYTLTISEPEAC